MERNEVFNERGNFTLPRNFHMPESIERGRAASDRSSDISLPFSDSCSESSGDSDHLSVGNPHSPSRSITKRMSYDENQNERLKIAEERLYSGLMRSDEQKKTKNPLENVVHWVIEPPKQVRPHINQVEHAHTDNAHPRRPKPPKRGDSKGRMVSVERVHELNGQPARSSKSTAL